jgi:hypothetical protein
MATSREVVMPESIKHASPKKFPLLLSGRWRVLLIPFGVTQERAFVQVGELELRVCFGPLFDYRFPLEAVETTAPTRWPLWAGIGPRVDFRGMVAFVGAYENAVEVRFKERQRMRMLVPVPCQRLIVSLEDPEAFIAALEKRTATTEAPAKAA